MPIDDLFDYFCQDQVSIGQYVVVPFGNRKVVGVVVDVDQNTSIDFKKIKKVIRADNEILFDEHLFKLFRFAANYYQYPIGQTIHTALPTRIKKDLNKLKKKAFTYSATSLLTSEYIENISPRKKKLKLIAMALLQKNINDMEIKKLFNAPNLIIRELLEKGLIKASQTQSEINTRDSISIALNEEQQEAVNEILSKKSFHPFLIFGITGSGKTEVYMKLIDSYLKNKGQVLVMVPEINLTPQLEKRFEKRFPGNKIISLHSHLTDSDRLENWRAAKSGQAQIIIGTRLSVFTPFKNLRGIIIDEEHDGSYKQQDNLRYHARDVAMMRAKLLNIPFILGSATPSLESWALVKSQKLNLLKLTKRAFQDATLPVVRLIQKSTKLTDNYLSEPLLDAIQDRLSKKQQSIIFINRRGYAPVLFCSSCSSNVQCPKCSTSLVVHNKNKKLRCHHCDYQKLIDSFCAQCGNLDLITLGSGTQRIEEILSECFPQARIQRVDRDTMKSKNKLDKLYQEMTQGSIDILIGTQMLSKGHDFANVTLVGIVDADHALFSHDFRASEKLFSQLVQVSGRSGRHKDHGEVIIDTNFGKHPIYSYVQKQDYELFAEIELNLRKNLNFPPFFSHAVLKMESKDLRLLEKFSSFTYELAIQLKISDVKINPPTRPYIEKVNLLERAHMFFESNSRNQLNQLLCLLRQNLMESKLAKKIKWVVDVDPIEF